MFNVEDVRNGDILRWAKNKKVYSLINSWLTVKTYIKFLYFCFDEISYKELKFLRISHRANK